LVKPSGSWEVDIVKPNNKVDFELGEKIPYALPIATPERLGGVQPDGKTEEMTLPVGVDEQGKLWTSGSDEAVLFVEQSLTDEQREQARKNIAKCQYNWRELPGINGTIYMADCSPIFGNSYAFDIDAALNTTSVAYSGFNSVYAMSLYGKMMSNAGNESMIIFCVKNICMDLDNLISLGITPSSIYIAIKDTTVYHEDEVETLFSISARKGTTNGVNFTHIFNANLGERIGSIYYNIETGQYVNSLSIDTHSDKTLSQASWAADAKAVGDALAQKADKSELDEKIDKSEIATDDEIIDMLTQEDMLPVVTDSDGSILADENSNILLW
jgi:hypothetical protein